MKTMNQSFPKINFFLVKYLIISQTIHWEQINTELLSFTNTSAVISK